MVLITKEMSLHDIKVSEMKKKPKVIGLDNIVLSTGEVILFDNHQIRREPDGLMFDPYTHRLYNIEYKCGKNLDKAKYQLSDSRRMLRDIFPGWEVINLYIHEDYKIERLR